MHGITSGVGSSARGRRIGGARAAGGLAGRLVLLVLLAVPAVAPAQPAPAQPAERTADPGDVVQEDEMRVLDDVTEPQGRPWAEGVPLHRRRRAHEHFRAGNAHFSKQAAFAEAAEQYRAALALWDHPAFHYNLGIVQMQLGQQIDAYEHFLAARAHGARPITEERYQQAQEWLDRLRAQLGELEVVCNEPGAEVVVDGNSLFTGPGRRRVMVFPGSHRVQASKPRFVPDIQPVVIDPGDSERVIVSPRAPAHLITVRRWPGWTPWAVAGAGAVALAGAGAMDWHSTRLFDRFDRGFHDRCSGSSACRDSELPGALRAELRGGRAWQWAARATYVAGGLTVATSVALFYLNRERILRQQVSLDPDQVSVMPMLTPHGAGVSAQFWF